MNALFASGHVVDAILALTAAEALAIAVYHRTGRGPPLEFLITLLSGVFLLLALRGALVGAGWLLPALCLLAALAAHLTDLHLRWRRKVRGFHPLDP